MASSNGHAPRDAEEEKQRLIALLGSSRRAAIEALRGMDEYAVVYPESGWRVKDVLGHLAAWEREALAALQAYHEHDEYTLGEDYELARYNEENYQKRREFYPAQCRIDWGMVRRDLQFAVHDLDPARLFDEMLYPWGERGTVPDLIESMIAHEEEHIQEMLEAVESV